MTDYSTKEKAFKLLNLSIPVLMGIFIFLNPFPYTTAVKEIAFYGSVGIILILACLKKLEFSFRSPLSLPFGLFALWAFIGLFFALDKENSIHDFQAHLLKYLIFYYVLINYFDSREWLLRLSWIIMISVALFSAGEIVYFYVLRGNPLSTKLVTGIPEIAVNWVGIVTIPAIILCLHSLMTQHRLLVKAASLACLLPAVILCFLTQARGTLLAMFLSVIILCFKNKKVLFSCLGVVLIFALTTPIKDRFDFTDPSNNLRLATYYINYEIIKDNPVLGIGFGMETYGKRKFVDLEAYSRRIPEHFRPYFLKDPHSMPFSIAVRTGLVGLGLFLFILFVPVKMAWSCIRQENGDWEHNWARCLISAWTAVLIIGVFEPFFSHVPEVAFYTLLAMMTIVWKLSTTQITQ